jgi:hypothetical protein
MITNQLFINPLLGKSTAFETARFLMILQGQDFYGTLAQYHLHGLVISRSDLFVMAREIDYEGEPAWFCRFAVGDLKALLDEVPHPRRWLCFTRRNEIKLRAVRLDRLTKKVKGRK